MLRQITAFLLMLAFLIPGVVSAEEEYWEYTFRPGDTIWDIAKKYTTSVNNWDEIQHINLIRIGADRKIRPGTRIVIPVSMLKMQPTPALVLALNGDVSVIRANGDKQTLTTETKLYSGDRIVTTSQQSVRLQFADLSELQILPGSEVVLDKLSHYKQTGMVDTRIRLNSGAINTQVEKQRPDSHYQITTPSAITAVRGTSFRLSTDEQQVSRTEVTGGVVAVSAGESEKSVNDGFGIVAEKDKPLPEPVKLLAAPVITIDQPADKTKASVTWKTLDGAKQYRYQIAKDEKFNQVIIDTMTSTNTVELDTLSPGNYYLRIRGIDQYRLGGLDSIEMLEIKQAPPPPPPPVEEDWYWKVIMSVGLLIIIL
jgi:hypothetical protein